MKKGFLFLLSWTFLCAAKIDSNIPSTRNDSKGSYTLSLEEGAIFMEGEYLYWKPYAFISYFVRSEGSAALITTDRVDPQLSLKAHSGYRLELGFYLPTSTWYTSAQYTQFFSEGDNFISTNGGPITTPRVGQQRADIVWPYREPTFGEGNPVQANAHERIRLKIVDMIFCRTFKTKYSFTFDPYFGVRYARVKLDMQILYSQPQFAGPYTGFVGTVDVDLNNHFNSWGLRAGLKANWKLGKGFEIFGNTSLSSLLGTFLLRDKQSYFRFGQSAGALFDALSTSTQKLRDIYLAYQFALGLLWGKQFKGEYYFGIKLGYETNIWPNFIRLQAYPGPFAGFQSTPQIFTFKNNLSTQGLIASMRLDF